MPFYVYILQCVDGSFYTGMTSELEARLYEHQTGVNPESYTYTHRPVELVWMEEFQTHDEAFNAERQVKGWSRKKKIALINNDYDTFHQIVTDGTQTCEQIRKRKQLE